jgi:hypothetical protein
MLVAIYVTSAWRPPAADTRENYTEFLETVTHITTGTPLKQSALRN